MSNAVQKHEPAELESSVGAVSGLVKLAIERGVDVAVLERLVALQERVTERNARAAFFEAVAAFQEECPEVHKSRTAEIATNSGARYSYTFAPLEEITRTIRPILKKHGLAYSWDVEASSPGVLDVVCVLRHVEGHEERSRFPVPTDSPAKMSAAQKNGAALTYGRRQTLVAVLGLVMSDDADGADPTPPEPISEYQVRELEQKIEATGADRARFLAFVGVDDPRSILAGDYQKAMKALDRKAKKAGR